MTMLPKQTASEKKTCVIAANQTFGLSSASHRGFIKYQIPFQAPFNVTARMSKIPKITYGNNARKYEAFPELRIPLIRTPAMKIHAMSKNIAKSKIG